MNTRVLIIGAVLFTSIAPTAQAVSGDFIHRKYESFEVVMNCEKRAVELYKAVVSSDTGNRRREEGKFQLDPSVPSECQQRSTGYYGPGYHRGHLQGANTSENTLSAYQETFFMTNVLPMTKELNVGAWHYSDQIIECLRDQGQSLIVMGGPIWDGPHSSNMTMAKHGTPIPSSLWKVIKRGEQQIAWIMPNSKASVHSTLPKWESTVEEIEKATGMELPVDLDLYRNYRPDSWYNTSGCDLK